MKNTNNNETTTEMEPATAQLISSYNPLKSKVPVCSSQEWDTAGPVVREAVSRLAGFSPRGLRPYLTSMTRIAVWALREGLPLEIPVVLSPAFIEAHIATLPASAGTFRSQLRRLAAANAVPGGESAMSYNRPGYTQPYTYDDVQVLLNFASSLSNEHRRRQLTGVILLGAGCGFSRGDLRGVSKSSVHSHDGVTHVRTSNRCTPILEEFLEDFDMYLDWCGTEPFVGLKTGHNITDQMASWVGDRAGVPKLSTDRLRAFFVVEHLRRGTPVMTLLDICGFANIDAVGPYLSFLAPVENTCTHSQEGAS
jgi:hypothetical protein